MNLDELLAMTQNIQGMDDDGGVPSDDALLERNLAVLSIRSPGEASRIRNASVRSDMKFFESEEGLSATIDGIALASKRRPLSESKKLASSIDAEEVAVTGVLGFGLGYHCDELVERLGEWGLVVCYEPDLGILRSVLSRIDFTRMFASKRFVLVCEPGDSVRCNQAFSGAEALVGMGVRLVAHPPSKGRLALTSELFGQTFTDALRAARTNVVTTLANARTTVRNAMMNTEHYVRSAGIEGLKDSCVGKPAIVVAAGPSLEKNIEQLCDPSVRERFVIIAVQTVLKPMLAKGIRPHFVAAIDYHEVSGRFYEGLTAEDVRGVRLIAEAKANPVILDTFPGEVVCPSDDLLDRGLGEALRVDRGKLPLGATVAHLCYNFARYLGCDPVILIGQDLGFSDGQYYANEAAIHSIWGCELSAHRTIEMFEWERVARMRAHLHRREDIFGKKIYADEQMCSYLAMFEEMFRADCEQGLRVIDASEGGVLKKHAEIMTLSDALERFDSGAISLPSGLGHKSDAPIDPSVDQRLAKMHSDAQRIERISEETVGLLNKMIKHQGDQRRVGQLVERVHKGRDEIKKKSDAFYLIESVNQIAVLNRMRRDRVIKLRAKDADAQEKQRLQIERDIENVKWTRDAARSMAELIEQTREVLRGDRDKVFHESPDEQALMDEGDRASRTDRVHAMILADTQYGGLGTARDLGARALPESMGGLNVLQTTIARVDRSAKIDAITVVTPDPDGVRALMGSMTTTQELNIVACDESIVRDHALRVGKARMQSMTSWRGSLGMLCVYDEAAVPALFADIMEAHQIDGVAVIGADWAMIDPALVDETIGRFSHLSSDKRIAFSQALPGVGTMVIDRETMVSLRDSKLENGRRNHFATLGTLISYLPTAPQTDPIIRGVCVQAQAELRDAGVRAIADSVQRIDAIQQAYTSISDPMGADAMECVRALSGATRVHLPRTLVIETCTGRLLGGRWGAWRRGSLEAVERRPIEMSAAHALMRELGQAREDACVVFDGVGDPLMHPGALDLVTLAKEDGIACVEMRTDLLREGASTDELIDSGVDILSVDLVGDSAESYEQLAGIDGYGRVCDRLQNLHDANIESTFWLAARMIRCEQTLDQIESFYDKWLLLTGCATIEPLPACARNQRIGAMSVPKWRRDQMEREIMRIRCDGVVIDAENKAIIAQGSEINAIDEGVERAYQRMRSAVRASALELKLGAGEFAA